MQTRKSNAEPSPYLRVIFNLPMKQIAILAIFAIFSISVMTLPVFAETSQWGYPLYHDDTTYELRPSYPVVGQTAELTLTVTHNEFRGYTTTYDDNNNPIYTSVPYGTQHLNPVRLSIADSNNPHYRLYDVTSNIGSVDPTVFTPYDYTTETTIAEPGKTYTVKGKVEILREGFVDFGALSFEGDKLGISLAVGTSETLPIVEYYEDNETFLDHLSGVSGQQSYSDSASFSGGQLSDTARQFPINYLPNLTEEQQQASLTAFYEKILDIYNAHDSSDAEIIKDLDGFSRQTIIDFFKNYKGYDQSVIDTFDIPYDSAESNEFGVSTFTLEGSIEARGYLNDAYIPIHGIKVCAYDYYDGFDAYIPILVDSEKLCDYTSSITGSFIIKNIPYADVTLGDNTNVDISIQVISDGESDLTIRDGQKSPYVAFSNPINNVNTTTAKIELFLNGSEAGAARIIDTVYDARDFFKKFDIDPQPLYIKWRPNGGVYTFPPIQPAGPIQPTYNHTDNVLTLNGENIHIDDDSQIRYNILREFGHHIADITDTLPASTCIDSFVFSATTNSTCAWYEGWAAFVPHLVDNSTEITYNSDGDTINIETLQVTRDGITLDESIKHDELDVIGHISKARIAGALWDIRDTSKIDPFDYLGNMLKDNLSMDNSVVITQFKNPSTTFEDFYNTWEDTNLNSTAAIMQLHDMAFAPDNLPPTCKSFDVTVKEGSSNVITLEGKDEKNASLRFTIDEYPTQGSLAEINDGDDYIKYLYSVNFDVEETDKIIYTVRDGLPSDEEAFDSSKCTVNVKTEPNVTQSSIIEDFDNLDSWIMHHDEDIWQVTTPQKSGDSINGTIASAKNCDDQCIIIFNTTLNTTSLLEFSFDQYLSRHIDADEGLYLQYSTDNVNWHNFLSFDGSNNTNTWVPASVILNIEESRANIRFVADTDKSSKIFEIDNFRVVPITPITFNATSSNALDTITLNFDRPLDMPLIVNNFTISSGNITNVDTVDDPQIILNVTGIDYYTDVAVKYVGEEIKFQDNYYLLNGEQSTADGIPGPVQNLTAAKTAYSFTITWAEDGATQYNVRVLEPGHFDEAQEVITSDNSTTIGDLKPWIKYKITVYPDGNFELKNEIQKFTKIAPKLQGLEVRSNGTGLEIFWDDQPDVNEYVVRVIEQSNEDGYNEEFRVSNSPATVPALEPDTEYRIVVLPNGYAEPKATQDITTPASTTPPVTTPDTIQNLDVTFTHNTISITWDDDFTNYEVRVFPIGQYTPGEFITTNNYFVNGLTHDTDYRIVVVPDGVEDKKAAQEITTLSEPPIENLLVTPTATSLDISWNPHDGTSEYTVRVIEQPTGTSPKIEYTITETSKLVENLNPNTEYRVVVFSKDMPQARAFQHLNTLESAVPPSTPTNTYTPQTIENLSATKTKSSFNITWDDNGASSYTVRVIEPGFFDDRTEFITNDNFATVEDLKPYTQYKIIVAPENDFDYKQVITKTTNAAPVLQRLDVFVNGTTIEISWEEQDDVDEYVVRVIEHQLHTGYDERLEFTTTNNTKTVSNLEPNTEYRIVVLPDGHEQPKASKHIITGVLI